MYVLYKLLQIPLRPEVWILALVAAAAWKRSRRLAIAAGVLFYALTTRPMHELIVRPLENTPLPNAEDVAALHPRAIVVLGGGAAIDPATKNPTIFGETTLDRTVCGIVLAKAFATTSGSLDLVFAGGVGDAFGHSAPEAPAMRELALSLGVPEEKIRIDDASRTTAENAERVKDLLGEGDPILLATSAIHLPRAMRRFREAGLVPIGAPCDRRVTSKRWDIHDFVPRAWRLDDIGDAVHEWAGLAVAR